MALDADTANPEAQEMETSLGQALTCTACTFSTPAQAPSPGSEGFPSMEELNRPISPRDTTSPTSRPGYDEFMTPTQKRRYLELVLEYATAEYLQNSERPEEGELDVDGLLTTAVYRVDRHVYLHYTVGRGMLGFCRDVGDVVALREWLGVIAQAGSKDENANETRARKRRKGVCGFSRWPNDSNQMVDQVAIWRRAWRQRIGRVESARLRWMWILDARKKEE